MILKRISLLSVIFAGAIFMVQSFRIATSEPNASLTMYLPIIAGSGDEGGNPSGVGTDQFPLGLAVASPFETVEVTPPLNGIEGVLSGTWDTAYDSAIDQINSILSGSAVISDVFDSNSFLQTSGRAECYGPNLDYTDHVDSPGAAYFAWILPGPVAFSIS